MKKIIKYLIERPLGVYMSFLLACILSIIAFSAIKYSLFPETNISKINVSFENSMSSASDFEISVVSKIRQSFFQIESVENVQSFTSDNKAHVEIQFEPNTQMDYKFLEVNQKIDALLPSLPKIKRPKVLKFKLTDFPSIYLSVKPKSTNNLGELSMFVENILKNQFEQSNAVSIVDFTGHTSTMIKLVMNTELCHSLGISYQDIVACFRNSDINLGSIEINEGNRSFNLSFKSEITSIEEIKELNIKASKRNIKLKSLVHIEPIQKNKNGSYLINGNEAINMAIIKSPKVSYNKFKREVNQIIKDLRLSHSDIEIKICKDQTDLIESSLFNLTTSLILGFIFSFLCILFFLRSLRLGLILLLCLIISLVLTFSLFYLFDISINLLSSTGLILGIGLMIDNSIIVLDNINQKVQENSDVKLGVIEGTSEVFTALIASSVSTSSIFLPLLGLSGLAGVLFFEQAMAIVICLFCSFLVSTILLPSIYFHSFKKNQLKRKDILKNKYGVIDKFFKRHFSIISTALIVLFIGGAYSGISIKKSTIPKIKEDVLTFIVDWNENLGEPESKKRLKELNTNLTNLIRQSEIFIDEQVFFVPTNRNESRKHQAFLELNLASGSSKEKLRESLQSYLKTNFPQSRLKEIPYKNSLNLISKKENYDVKVIVTEKELYSQVNDIFQTNNISFYSTGPKRSYSLHVRDEQLSKYRIQHQNLIDFIRFQLGSKMIHSFRSGKNSIPIIFDEQVEKSDFLQIEYPMDDNRRIKLDKLITLNSTLTANEIEGYNSDECKIFYVKSNTPKDIISLCRTNFGETSSIKFGGSALRNSILLKEFSYVLLVSILLLYLILTIQFNSLKIPLVILSEIPICVSFSLLLLYACGYTLNIMSFIGILMMIGIVINDSILKVDLINSLRLAGRDIDLAIKEGGERRLSSILMTSLTTILAIIPVFFQSDPSSQLQWSLIISLVSGLAIGTFLSVSYIPIIFKKIIK